MKTGSRAGWILIVALPVLGGSCTDQISPASAGAAVLPDAATTGVPTDAGAASEADSPSATTDVAAADRSPDSPGGDAPGGIAADGSGDGSTPDSGDAQSVLGGAPVAIAVASAPPCTTIAATGNVLFDLGHVRPITVLRRSGDRILSQDDSGHWVLWSVTQRSQIASGDSPLCPTGPQAGYPQPVDLQGDTVAVGNCSSIALLSAADAHLLSTIKTTASQGNPFHLASDGSYVWMADDSGLTAWSLAGKRIVHRQGPNYPSAAVFAAPQELRVAFDLVGSGIELISTATGLATNTGAFEGAFDSWFLDGNRFLTTDQYTRKPTTDAAGNLVYMSTVTVYSKDAIQEDKQVLPYVFGRHWTGWPGRGESYNALVGQGRYFWTKNQSATTHSSATLRIYEVGGGGVPAWTSQTRISAELFEAGNLLAEIDAATGALDVLDLSGPAITVSRTTVGYDEFDWTFAADGSGHWSLESIGRIFDDAHAGIGGGPAQPMNCGEISAIAGAETGRVALATRGGPQVLLLDLQPAARTLSASLAVGGYNRLALSSDGAVLATEATALTLLDVPAATNAKVWWNTLNGPSLVDFSLSADGTRLGQVAFTRAAGQAVVTDVIADLKSGMTDWSNSSHPPKTFHLQPRIALSPSGKLVALSDAWANFDSARTNIFEEGWLVGTTLGLPVGWIDESRLLVSTYHNPDPAHPFSGQSNYAGAKICDVHGNVLSSPALPELLAFHPVGTTQIYDPTTNAIYDLSDGHAVWKSMLSPAASISRVGDVVGGDVVFVSGTQVLIESH